MIKAKSKAKDGRDVFLFGLSDQNVEHLMLGEPIYFAGAELDLPNLHFLIAYIPDGPSDDERIELSKTLHSKFAKNDPRYLFSMMLTREALMHLRTVGAQELQHPKIPGIVLLMHGPTEEAIVESLRLPGLKASAPGTTQRYDPILGMYVTTPREGQN